MITTLRAIVVLVGLHLAMVSTLLSQISGTIEHFDQGTAYLMAIGSRDTLDISPIENHQFYFDYTILIKEDQALPALVMCLQHDHKQSSAAGIAIENIPIQIHFHEGGVQSYTGTPLQEGFSAFVNEIFELEKQVNEKNSTSFNDSIHNAMDIKLDSFYILNRNSKLRNFTSLIIFDFINRKLIDPTHLPQIQALCNENKIPDEADARVCDAMRNYKMSWEGKQSLPLIGLQSDCTIFNLNEILGSKIIILDFWASWCGPCIKEIPELKELYSEGNIEIIGISIDNQKGPWLKVLEKLDLPWINIWDEGKEISTAYNVTAVPTKFVINKNGIIVARNPEDLRAILASLK